MVETTKAQIDVQSGDLQGLVPYLYRAALLAIGTLLTSELKKKTKKKNCLRSEVKRKLRKLTTATRINGNALDSRLGKS